MRRRGAVYGTACDATASRVAKGQINTQKTVLSSWSSVIEYCRAAMAFADKEQFRILFLDKRNQLIADEVQTGLGRTGRFLFGCDTLLRDYRQAHPLSPENDHFHGDYRMIALYLAFRYPESYAPYDFPAFQQAMAQLGARDVPQQNDLPRYFKVLKTLTTFLEKDGEAEKNIKKHLHPTRHFQGKTLLLTEDFLRFAAENPF